MSSGCDTMHEKEKESKASNARKTLFRCCETVIGNGYAGRRTEWMNVDVVAMKWIETCFNWSLTFVSIKMNVSVCGCESESVWWNWLHNFDSIGFLFTGGDKFQPDTLFSLPLRLLSMMIMSATNTDLVVAVGAWPNSVFMHWKWFDWLLQQYFHMNWYTLCMCVCVWELASGQANEISSDRQSTHTLSAWMLRYEHTSNRKGIYAPSIFISGNKSEREAAVRQYKRN